MNYKAFMNQAIALAKEAGEDGEVPVGAVVVKDSVVIGRGRNRREKGKNVLAHAEIEAISEACKTLGDWRLSDCDLYVTLEPCIMCFGAIVNARINRVIFGAYDEKAGACISTTDIDVPNKPKLLGGYMETECTTLLTDFFKKLR